MTHGPAAELLLLPSAAMTEVKGANGESIVFDGATVSKFRHGGKQEVTRNTVSTFREVQISQKKSLFGKVKNPGEYEVMLVMGSIMSLTVDEAGKAAMEAMVAEIEAAANTA